MKVAAIELRTGVAIEYAEPGDRSGTPLLLLPGLGDSWHSFKPVLDAGHVKVKESRST